MGGDGGRDVCLILGVDRDTAGARPLWASTPQATTTWSVWVCTVLAYDWLTKDLGRRVWRSQVGVYGIHAEETKWNKKEETS